MGEKTEDEVVEELKQLDCEYIVFQKETGGQLGRDHIQGYVYFSNPKMMGGVKRLLPCDAHLEKRQAPTVSDAANYCKKDETRRPGTTFFEKGVQPMDQGKKRTLKEACDLLEEGGIEAVIDAHPDTFVQYSRGLEKLAHHYQTKKLKTQHRNVEVMICWGDPGSGKSYWAQNYCPQSSFNLPVANKGGVTWFDGYSGEKCLVIEDFTGKVDYRNLLQYLDNYPLQVQVKGGYVWAEWEMVIITSNFEPNTWYSMDDGDWWSTDDSLKGPLQRRVNLISHWKGAYPNNKVYVEGEEVEGGLPNHNERVRIYEAAQAEVEEEVLHVPTEPEAEEDVEGVVDWEELDSDWEDLLNYQVGGTPAANRFIDDEAQVE